MEKYELAVLYHPDLEIDLEKAETRVKKIITDNGGSIESTDNWGKRKLAYKINGQEYAVYVFYMLDMPKTGVSKLNDTLNITDEVFRFMISKPDFKRKAKAEAARAEREAEKAERAKTEETPAAE
jgi:small subunit ribosomal protein S6